VSAEPSPAELSAFDSRGSGIRVRFFWHVDRYAHRIDAVDGLLSRTLLESVEGEPLSGWPSSPPFQQVNVSWIVSDSQQGQVAMLVGATGDGHWSMGVGARGNESAETTLFFDVACRIDRAPKFLGSSYRVLGGSAAISERLNCAFVPANEPGCVLIAQDAEITLEKNRSRSPILRCKATEIRFAESPVTLRWHYVVRRSSGGPLRVTTKRPNR
jgi:hypothetical protein